MICGKSTNKKNMLVLKLTPKNLKTAVKILQRGGVIVYPTDTAYGLGGIFDSQEVKNKIYKIKIRPRKKLLPLIAADLKMVKKFFELKSINALLAKKYWPGAFSLILKNKKKNELSAVRIPNNKTARTLSKGVGYPIFSTSANLSGNSSLYKIKEVIAQFTDQKNKPDLILDASNLRKRKVSTIVKVKDEKIEVIREGAIKLGN